MSTLCPSCGNKSPETEGVCAVCSWDFAARKHAGKPLGPDLLFKPGSGAAPKPVPKPSPAALDPVDLAPPASPWEDHKFEAPMPTGFPSDLLNPLLLRIQRTEAGREALGNEYVQMVVAALRRPRVFIAAASVLGLWCASQLYMFLPHSAPAARPSAAPAAPEEYVRPAATFAPTPKVLVNAPEIAPVPAPAPAPAPVPAPAAPKAVPEPRRPLWTFEGSVFDLLTTRGVFAAKLTFVNARGAVVAQTETDAKGRYKIEIPSGSGITVRIEHPDYTGRYLDDGDASRSLRGQSLEDRRILMQAAARNLLWTGDAERVVTRDLALVPRTPDNQ